MRPGRVGCWQIGVVLAALATAQHHQTQQEEEEWSRQSTCVEIPETLTLCRGIGYRQMRLPNLLDHETLPEICHQASSWLPLLNLHCHGDSQLFLCSLFSPVCLDRPIYPCRSLCQSVRNGCESRMNAYGFPWPDMFNCDNFPVDNDMCIAPQTTSADSQGNDSNCGTCNQAETYENILDHFCRSDFVIKAKFRHVTKHKLKCKKTKILKGGAFKLKQPVLALESKDHCCEVKAKSSQKMFLIMGLMKDDKLVPRFIMPWKAKISEPFKKAVRMFKRLNCTNPQIVSHSILTDKFPLKKMSTTKLPHRRMKLGVEGQLHRTSRKKQKVKKSGKRYKNKTANVKG